MNKLIDFCNNIKSEVSNFKTVKFYKKYLSKPLGFVSKAISWSVFMILLVCAAFLIYYYVSMQTYSKNGAGYEPDFYLYTIISGSMYPTIEVYDVVFVKSVDESSDIEVGDIISYNSSSFVSGETISVTHRVVEIVIDKDNNYTYYTKGDNNLSVDNEGVSFSQISGTVEFRIPQLGRLQFFLASEIGWFLIIILPALFIIIKYIIQLLNLNKLFSKIPKDSKFFPLFNKKLLLPYNEIKNIESKDELDKTDNEFLIANKISLYNEEVKETDLNNLEKNVEEPIFEEKENYAEPIFNNNVAKEYNSVEKEKLEEKVLNNKSVTPVNEVSNEMKKEEIDLDISDIFEDLQNLTK